ncbi:unnamed protein product [Brachionus calyciflorus]|uniref:C-type lectin domain-containing protein n=1 Tax=Brachionus calyciflorus TaxID=104777 RepID=A0A813VR12_9BILA|nr:unnamed protein product [Brachionus calyciflorus]
MKNAFRISIGLVFLDIILLIHSTPLSSVFLTETLIIFDNESLILQLTTSNKFLCLQACMIESDCLYAHFDYMNCNLYTQHEKNILQMFKNNETMYVKTNIELNEKLKINDTESNYTSLNSSVFWSFKTNSFLSCRPGFQKYKQVSYLCYHSLTDKKTFTESREYCKLGNATLFEPKTENERYFFSQNFWSKNAYVNSVITYKGETYKWPNGSIVMGFAHGQPNNHNSNGKLTKNCLEIHSNGYLNDVSCDKINHITICQHD